MFQVINVESTSASMMPSKVEIKLKKAEPGAWAKLDFPRAAPKQAPAQPQVQQVEEDDLVDLSTVEAIQSMGRVNVTE